MAKKKATLCLMRVTTAPIIIFSKAWKGKEISMNTVNMSDTPDGVPVAKTTAADRRSLEYWRKKAAAPRANSRD